VGVTLALAYAEAQPDRVSELVLVAVTMTRRAELDRLYRGVRRCSPPSTSRSMRASAAPAALGRHPPGRWCTAGWTSDRARDRVGAGAGLAGRELVVVEGAGHSATAMADLVVAATERYATRQ
jgi:pimeloyl-ACP methyl ester carboxylesterase